MAKLKHPDDSIELNISKKLFGTIKRPEDLKTERILEDINKYKDINLNGVNNLIKEIEENIKMGDNILDLGDDKFVFFF